MNPEPEQRADWKWCTFEGAELNALLVGLKTSFREKIIWMEGMQDFHQRFAEGRSKRLRGEGSSRVAQG